MFVITLGPSIIGVFLGDFLRRRFISWLRYGDPRNHNVVTPGMATMDEDWSEATQGLTTKDHDEKDEEKPPQPPPAPK